MPTDRPTLTLHGDDKLMWVVDGVPVATATRDELLAALGVESVPYCIVHNHLKDTATANVLAPMDERPCLLAGEFGAKTPCEWAKALVPVEAADE